METKVVYSQIQLKSAVKFISKYNYNFLKQDKYIEEQILSYMEDLAKDNNCSFISCMGFELRADRQLEDLDNTENVCYVEILVDPALKTFSSGYYDSDEDFKEFSVSSTS